MSSFFRKRHLVVLALMVCCAGLQAEPKQPNVLFIFADDMSYETIGAAGIL